jgi:hypothetical protein
MRWRIQGWTRRTPERQRLMPFRERAERRQRQLKRAVVVFTVLAIAALLGGTSIGRYAVGSLAGHARLAALRQFGLEPDRAEVEAARRVERTRTLERVRESLTNYYRGASPEMQDLFRVAKMDPEHGLIGSGRTTEAFLLAPEVFAADGNGRSYRLRPGQKSVWLRQITLVGGPFSLFLVPDTEEVRAAAVAAGAIVDDSTAQTTNSWGLRGPEPDPNAPVRGIVLGDSFMQGMFVGDNDTPPQKLERTLAEVWRTPVSILNTGHIGYSPEQYYFSLKEYGDRFRPQFVVVSVCPNDFGPPEEVMLGQGNDWEEAGYWLEKITRWCRGHAIPCVLAPVPCDVQILGMRRDDRYPAPVSRLFRGGGTQYCDALDQFVDEHLRLRRERERQGKPRATSPLYNGEVADHHFSPAGSALWARIIARRLDLVMTPPVEVEVEVEGKGRNGTGG